MKYYFEQLAALIRDHTFITASISIVIALLGSAYAIGFQLGQNRQVYLEDRIASLQSDIQDHEKTLSEARTKIGDQDIVIKSLEFELKGKIEELSNARISEGRLASFEKINETMATNLSAVKRKLAESRAETDQLEQNKSRIVAQVEQLSAENHSLREKYDELLEKFDRVNSALKIKSQENDSLKSYKTKIEETIFQAAAGDLVARVTGDQPWIDYFKIEDVSRVSTAEFPFVALLGSTYKIEDDVIYDVTNGIRKVVFAGEPKAAAIGKKVCFGYLTKLANKRLKANAICRKNEVTSRGIYD